MHHIEETWHPSRGTRGGLALVERVGIGVIGLGRMGRHHAENLATRVRSVELKRVVDANEETALKVSKDLGDVEWSTDYKDLLSDPDIDAVVIASPTALHADQVEAAAAAGKHIFCEKPISLDLSRTQEVIRTVRATGVKMQVGFHRRFDSGFRAAYERIKTGELGDVYFLRLSVRDMEPPSFDFLRKSGGIFADVTLHDFDMARWLVGEIEEVTAIGTAVSDPRFKEMGDVDVAIITLRFRSGALGVIDNSRVSGYGFECSGEIMGSKSTLRLGGRSPIPIEILQSGVVCRPYALDFMDHFSSAYVQEMEAFAETILSRQDPSPDGTDAEAAFVLVQAATRSYREGRPVRLQQSA
jgi:myo-inositol 2-dehydrogenase/D-chiro-inositol 1-dehydrogenase